MRKPTPWTRELERGLAGLGLVALSLWSWEVTDARIHHRAQERRLASLATAGKRTRAEMATSGLIGRLEVPRLRLVAIVEEGADQHTLRRAVGHLPGTALPGEAGNLVVAAHRDTFFRALKDVRPGDRVRFVTPDGEFEYTVTSLDVVAPTETDVVAQGARPEATLITCYPFGFVGPAPQRFVVRAALSDSRLHGSPLAGLSAIKEDSR
jgi:sortase A